MGRLVTGATLRVFWAQSGTLQAKTRRAITMTRNLARLLINDAWA
jgi:hypothetical protein